MAKKLEDASLQAWPAIEQKPLDGWQLRFSHGFSRRGNSVQPIASSSTPLAEKVARCEAWYEERERPCMFRLTPFSDRALDDFLEARGYRQEGRTAVLQRMISRSERPSEEVEMHAAPLEEWLAAYARMSLIPGGAPSGLKGILETMHAERLLGVLWSREMECEVACGIAALDAELVGLFDLVTSPEHRRQGYGVELVRSLMRWAGGRRARRAYLQVARSNVPALRLYEKLGFLWVYDYWYRVRS